MSRADLQKEAKEERQEETDGETQVGAGGQRRNLVCLNLASTILLCDLFLAIS